MGVVLDIIKTDLYRHKELRGYKGLLKGWFLPGFRYTLIFRLISARKNRSPFWWVLRILRRRYRLRYGFEIDLDAKIGEGFYLSDHCGPVIIGPVTIGKHCNVAHSVTIGRSYSSGELGRPTIGDKVWIGTGSVLVGNIKIGSDVLIAPNAFVNMDVPDHSLVLGNPAKIIPRENPTKFYINRILGE